MKKNKIKLAIFGLCAMGFSLFGPDLSTPISTVKTFLTEIKSGRDPLPRVCYKEKIDKFESYYAQFGRSCYEVTHNGTDPECKKDIRECFRKFGLYVDNCTSNIESCIKFDGPPEGSSKEEIRDVVLSQQKYDMHFILQKESDKNWRLIGTFGPLYRE